MDDIEPDGLKIVQTRPFSEMKSAGNRFHPGDLLYGRLRPYLNKTAVASFEGACSGELLVFSPSAAIESRYLQYFMHSRAYVGWVSAATSGDRPRVSFETAAGFAIPLAPLPEQRRIVARINALFAEIAEGEAALAAARRGLETYRRALLKAAVTGELTADWREANKPAETGDDLLARVRAERETNAERRTRDRRAVGTPSDKSILPKLPKGWVWASLSEIIDQGPTNGYSPKQSTNGSGTRSLKLTATTRGQIDLSENAVKTLSEVIPTDSALFLRSGDILFQRGNTPEYVGIAAIYQGPESTFIYPDLMIRVRVGTSSLGEWIWRTANSPHGRKYLTTRATGTAGTMPKISGEILRNLPVPLPSQDEMTEILRRVADALSAASDAQAVLDAEAADAARLRQSILKAAFEGRLVPQDPADEPAEAMLARLQGEADGATPARRRRPSAAASRIAAN